jgi:hypothetical protein
MHGAFAMMREIHWFMIALSAFLIMMGIFL